MKFPMLFRFDPSPACRCRSRLAACAASTHARIKKKKNVTFLSPAWIFSEVCAPLCLLFLLKPFFPSAMSSTYYFQLITCLCQPPASHSVASLHQPGCRLSSTAGKCTPLMIDDFYSPTDSLWQSQPHSHVLAAKNTIRTRALRISSESWSTFFFDIPGRLWREKLKGRASAVLWLHNARTRAISGLWGNKMSHIQRPSFTVKYNGPSHRLNQQGDKSSVLMKLTMDRLGIDCAMKLARLLRDQDPSPH